jgi:predicted metallo-beta-lactamase superfamily hydrolase
MDIFELAEELKKEILTAAEFLRLDNLFLEAWRREIKSGKRSVDVEGYFRKLKEKMRKELENI